MCKKTMRLILVIFSLLFANVSFAFQCPSEGSTESLFHESETVFFVRIVATRIRPIAKASDSADFVEADYQLIESLKGNSSSSGKLLDLPGYGTGYAGLGSGVYYLLFLKKGNKLEGIPWVTMCDVKFGTFNPDGTEVRKKLHELRSLSAGNT